VKFRFVLYLQFYAQFLRAVLRGICNRFCDELSQKGFVSKSSLPLNK